LDDDDLTRLDKGCKMGVMKMFHYVGEGIDRAWPYTELLEATELQTKIIKTKDWGDFRVRKNGRIALKIGDEIIRCTPIR